MKIELQKPNNDFDRYTLHFGDAFINIENDWEQFVPFNGIKWNWISFHFLHVYFENDKMTGGLEFEFIVLGIGFRVRYNYAFEESEAGQRLKEFEDKHNVE